VGKVAVLLVVVVDVDVVVGVVVDVAVLVDVEVELEVLLVLEAVVGVEGVEVGCRWQSFWASCAIVPAAWLRLLRSVELTVTGRVRTSLERIWLALSAAPQFPDCTAEETASA
jgi:hypothetical protein